MFLYLLLNYSLSASQTFPPWNTWLRYHRLQTAGAQRLNCSSPSWIHIGHVFQFLEQQLFTCFNHVSLSTIIRTLSYSSPSDCCTPCLTGSRCSLMCVKQMKSVVSHRYSRKQCLNSPPPCTLFFQRSCSKFQSLWSLSLTLLLFPELGWHLEMVFLMFTPAFSNCLYLASLRVSASHTTLIPYPQPSVCEWEGQFRHQK